MRQVFVDQPDEGVAGLLAGLRAGAGGEFSPGDHGADVVFPEPLVLSGTSGRSRTTSNSSLLAWIRASSRPRVTKTTRNDRSSEPSCRLLPSMPEAFDDLRMSVDRFCLLAGLESLNEMMSADAEALCGSRHARSGERKGHRWGTTRSEIAYNGGKVKVERPRVRDFAGREMSLPSWELLSEPELLQAWAMNLMVINVSTRKYARAVRLPDDAGGDLPAASGVRAAMHPADQVEAFRRLADAGSTAPAIAARFGVSERTVEKRLRLGNAAPVLHEAYRAGEIDLDTLMAFAVTTDQARQNAVWETVGQQGYRPGAWQIKRLLTEDRVPATSAIVRFVGLEAYEAAGGKIDRDLFAEEDERRIWIDDPNLLNKLAMDSLQAAARELETRWKWAEARLDVDWSATAAFGRAARGPGASSRPRPDRASGRIGTNAPVVRPRAAFRRLSLVRRARARHRVNGGAKRDHLGGVRRDRLAAAGLSP